jgi:UDP-N-acetylglucosamine--N-acetylmuramyl-(pentapeptide) pyrophosphoryl-undecaprenol N-acetylglucosamine transferase
MDRKKLKVLIAAGGTGGHLFPAQQLARMLLEKEDCELVFAGHLLSQSPFFEKGSVPFCEIASARLKNPFRFFFAAIRGFFQSVALIRRFKPDAVVGFGSFHAFPVLLAAAVLRKKIILFEANCILGKVNRLFAPLAEKIAVQFPLQTPKRRQVFVPFLPWTVQGRIQKPESISSESARRFFHLRPDLLTLLVFGGSQGAAHLNQTVPAAAALLLDRGLSFQVIHLTGKGGEGTVSYDPAIPSCVKPFEKEMEMAYAAADFAICRSGAGTVAELIRFRKPAILIPFPFAADGHQEANGRFLAEEGEAARLVLQREATAERLAEEILVLADEREKKKQALERLAMGNKGKTSLADWVRAVVARRGHED